MDKEVDQIWEWKSLAMYEYTCRRYKELYPRTEKSNFGIKTVQKIKKQHHIDWKIGEDNSAWSGEKYPRPQTMNE